MASSKAGNMNRIVIDYPLGPSIPTTIYSPIVLHYKVNHFLKLSFDRATKEVNLPTYPSLFSPGQFGCNDPFRPAEATHPNRIAPFRHRSGLRLVTHLVHLARSFGLRPPARSVTPPKGLKSASKGGLELEDWASSNTGSDLSQ